VYYLHGKEYSRTNGRRQLLLFFSRRLDPAHQLRALPSGYRVVESPITGRPYARKL
jgi:hypothetical protein